MPLGGLPIRLGGGKSRTRRIHDEFRAALGDACPPRGDVEDARYLALARCLAWVESRDQAAVMERFPGKGQRLLQARERILGIDNSTLPQHLRLETVRARWWKSNNANAFVVAAELHTLDSRLSVGTIGALVRSEPGRTFPSQSVDEGPLEWTRDDAQCSFLHGNAYCVVTMDVGHDEVLTESELRTVLLVREMLRHSLPADARANVHAGAMVLDHGALDQRCLT